MWTKVNICRTEMNYRVPIGALRWYRLECYGGTDSSATMVPFRRYYQMETEEVYPPELVYRELGYED